MTSATIAPTAHRPGGAAARMLVFDLLGPLVAYKVLRSHSVDSVHALLVAAAFPLVGVLITALRERHLDTIGMTVLAGTGSGAILSLIINSPKPTLIFTGVLPGAVFAVACLLSLRSSRPLIFAIALTFQGGEDSAKGSAFAALWREQSGFRRFFRIVTAAWGIGYLLEAGLKSVIVLITSTGHALVLAGVLSFGFPIALSLWTAGYAKWVQRG